jgi:hypothetical protein
MSSNFGEIVKKLIPVFGEKPAKLPRPPPPPTVPESGDFHTWRKCPIESRSAKSGHLIDRPDWGGGGGGDGEILSFLNHSTTEQYFKMLLSHEDVYSFSSPYCSGKLCSSPFYLPGK